MNMGLTAEQLQRKYNISREDAGRLLAPQPSERARARRPRASSTMRLSRRSRDASRPTAPSRTSSKTVFSRDEGPRADTTLEALAKLKPVFHANGTVTAGNSSQTSDGAAVALVMSEQQGARAGLKPMARFVSFATGGVPPEIMGIGPVVAIPKALALAGLKLDDIERDRTERSLRRAGAGRDPRSRASIWTRST